MEKQLKYFIFFALTLVLFSCANNSEETPEGVIPKDKMIEVLGEIELTQALIKLKLSTQDTVNQEQLFNEVYDEFSITQDQFNNSLTYYCEDPKSLMNMYGKVIEDLTKKQSEHSQK